MEDTQHIDDFIRQMDAIYGKFDPLIDAAEEHSTEWNQLTEQRREACENLTANTLENVKGNNRDELIHFIYWSCPIVRVRILAKYLGVSASSVAKPVGSGTWELECDNCSGTFCRTYKTRGKFEEDTKYSSVYPRPMCDKCKLTFRLGRIYFNSLNELVGYISRHPEYGAKGYDVFLYEDKRGVRQHRYYSRAQILEMLK